MAFVSGWALIAYVIVWPRGEASRAEIVASQLEGAPAFFAGVGSAGAGVSIIARSAALALGPDCIV